MKTRYAKPFEGVQVKIPYTTGMSPYSGLVDLLENKQLLKKDGNSLTLTTSDGVTIKQFRKAWERNENGSLDAAMKTVAVLDSQVPDVLADPELDDEQLDDVLVDN
jgi:hypothetical protein